MTEPFDRLSVSLEQFDGAASDKARDEAIRSLVTTVRTCVNDHKRAVAFKRVAEFSPVTWRSVLYDGVKYVTAMTAFQAQKAPPTARHKYAKLGPGEAALQGRLELIDSVSWDSNRRALMKKILIAQVRQHSILRVRMMKQKQFNNNMLGDPYWCQTLPGIWLEIKAELSDEASFEENTAALDGSGSDEQAEYDDEEEAEAKRVKFNS
jgi:predicted NAD-dependent protein-ADP-ribosyltransferase YbiA (DUF1768 family)